MEKEDIERIGTTIGNYHLQEILGRGGMGTVYSGEHVYIGKKVAVKVLHPQFAKYEDAVKRFLREARAASSINHPNIVDVTDFGALPDGGVYFVMEALTGTSLEDLIEQHGALPLHRGLNVANQMALALAAAHETGIVHRDLKPDNIMLIRKPGRRDLYRRVGDQGTERLVVEREQEYDFVKILDFGIAKVIGPEQSAPSKTLAGAVFGTPEYMSPEAARGVEVDFRADIYSLGVILYDMLCGRPPFEATAAADVLAMQIRDAPPSPRVIAPQYEITEAVENLIFRCMEKNPDHRFQSMDELREHLQKCYGSVGFQRNTQGDTGKAVAGPHSRQKRLTEELSDWFATDSRQISVEEARNLALGKTPSDNDE
ncbi:MAG: serine/threonine protein kinase [Kofleriaceae bacterium]|nr:serine/threonine protein kinase [Kofleriaceae bacterium]